MMSLSRGTYSPALGDLRSVDLRSWPFANDTEAPKRARATIQPRSFIPNSILPGQSTSVAAPGRMEFGMKLRGWMVALALFGASVSFAKGQDLKSTDLKSPNAGEYVPRLSDIMSAVQTRHQKLWLAGKAQNWELAAFELNQLKAGLIEAALLYSGI